MGKDVYSLIAEEIEKIVYIINKQYENENGSYAKAFCVGKGKWRIDVGKSKKYYFDANEILAKIENVKDIENVVKSELYNQIKHK